jgi:hypothetical protein
VWGSRRYLELPHKRYLEPAPLELVITIIKAKKADSRVSNFSHPTGCGMSIIRNTLLRGTLQKDTCPQQKNSVVCTLRTEALPLAWQALWKSKQKTPG